MNGPLDFISNNELVIDAWGTLRGWDVRVNRDTFAFKIPPGKSYPLLNSFGPIIPLVETTTQSVSLWDIRTSQEGRAA